MPEAPATQLRDQIEAWLAATEPQSHLERVWKLSGGVSSGMTAFTTSDRSRDQERTRILRQPNDWTLDNVPDAVRIEFTRLDTLHREGIPVQKPAFFDETASSFGRPGMVIEYIEGKPELRSDRAASVVQPAARQLADIHRVELVPQLALEPSTAHELPAFDAGRKPSGDNAYQVDRIWTTLAAHAGQPALNEPVLLHGDYWPGNILWRNEALVAVLDWEAAQIGDPLLDLSIARLDLWWIFGPRAVQEFTAHYLSLRPVDTTQLPLFDLQSALRPVGELETWATSYPPLGRPDITAKSMLAQHAGFVEQAFQALDLAPG